MEKTFITYGIVFDPEKFVPAEGCEERCYLNKPKGGLWASPEDSEFGWKDWCEAERFRLERLKTYTRFQLKKGTRILEIDDRLDLMAALQKYPIKKRSLFGGGNMLFLNFNKIKEDYDCVYLTYLGNRECHNFLRSIWMEPAYSDLNAWDCESVVVLRQDPIKILEIKK